MAPWFVSAICNLLAHPIGSNSNPMAPSLSLILLGRGREPASWRNEKKLEKEEKKKKDSFSPEISKCGTHCLYWLSGKKKKKEPRSFNICWSLDFSLHPSPAAPPIPPPFPLVKLKLKLAVHISLLKCHQQHCYYSDFSGQRPWVPGCNAIKRTLLLSDLAWQLHWIWVHGVIYWACWYTAAWFRRAKNPGMHQKAIYAFLLIIIIKINVSPKWLWWPLPLHLTF